MYACAWSDSVSNPSQPISCHAAAGSGSVTTMELFIGSRARRAPGSAAGNPSVQRSTDFARTAPKTVPAPAPAPAPPAPPAPPPPVPPAVGTARAAREDRRPPCRLVDAHAAPLRCRRKSRRQRGRLHPRAGRRVQPAKRAGHVDPLPGLLAGQERDDVLLVAPLAV